MTRFAFILAIGFCTFSIRASSQIELVAPAEPANIFSPFGTFLLESNNLSITAEVPCGTRSVELVDESEGVLWTYQPPADDTCFVVAPPRYHPCHCTNPPPLLIFRSVSATENLDRWEVEKLLLGQVRLRTYDLYFKRYILISIRPRDSDGDGVPNFLDRCPATRQGELVNPEGCSFEELCPCDANWKSHGDFLRTFVSVAREFEELGLIDEATRRLLIKQAVESTCGRRHRR